MAMRAEYFAIVQAAKQKFIRPSLPITSTEMQHHSMIVQSGVVDRLFLQGITWLKRWAIAYSRQMGISPGRTHSLLPCVTTEDQRKHMPFCSALRQLTLATLFLLLPPISADFLARWMVMETAQPPAILGHMKLKGCGAHSFRFYCGRLGAAWLIA